MTVTTNGTEFMKIRTALLAIAVSGICFAQAPPSYPPPELDRLVQRVALYPDPLLAQVLSASTFANEIPDAARWAAQRQDVMEAVQRERSMAMDYGYLRSGGHVVVARGGPYITILPVDPAFMYVPYYDPGVVFIAPRPGFAVGAAIN